MAKLSALVIPAVIDTSGIDKGVNSIRNKLSKVRGEGGVGGGSGFSSGVTPAGGHMPFGGGSAVGTAMAAAFGASTGRRSFEKGRDIRRAYYDKVNQNNFISHELDRYSKMAFAKRREYHRQGKELMDSMLAGGYMGRDDARLNPKYQDLMTKGDWWGSGWGYGKNKLPVGQRWRGVGMMLNKASTYVGEAHNALGLDALKASGRFGLIAGVGAIGMLGDKMGQRSQEATFGNLSRWEGSGNYQAALGIHQRAYDRRATPTFWEQVMLQDQKNAAAAGKTEGGLSSFGSMFDTLKELGANALAGIFDSPMDRIAAEAKREAASRGPQTKANNSIKSAFNI